MHILCKILYPNKRKVKALLLNRKTTYQPNQQDPNKINIYPIHFILYNSNYLEVSCVGYMIKKTKPS